MYLKIYNQNIWGSYAPGETVGNRHLLIKDMITDYNADLVSFQECGHYSFRLKEFDISGILSDVYEEVPTEKGTENFTPIYYKRDKFKIVESGWHLYSGKNDNDSKSITWCVFEEKTAGVKFAYLSTHFWWKAEKEEDNLQRIENVKEIYKLMNEIKDKYNIPVIFAGDLNCGENSAQGIEPIKKLYELGLVNLFDEAEVRAGKFTHRNKYPVKQENGDYYGDNLPDRILDHAFMLEDAGIKVKKYIIDNSIRALSSSDHLPMYIDLEIENM